MKAELERHPGVPDRLHVDGPWTAEIEELCRGRRIPALAFNSSRGWRGDGLRFLGRLPDVRSVDLFLHGEPVDTSGLREAPWLRAIAWEVHDLAEPAGGVAFDARWFPRLNVFRCRWSGQLRSVLTCPTLVSLAVIGLPDRELDFTESLPALEDLHLNRPRLRHFHAGNASSPLSHLHLVHTLGLTGLPTRRGWRGWRRWRFPTAGS